MLSAKDRERCRVAALAALREIPALEDHDLYQRVCRARDALSDDAWVFEDAVRLAWDALGDMPHIYEALDRKVWDAYALCDHYLKEKLYEQKARRKLTNGGE
jgi:hypothetical protein